MTVACFFLSHEPPTQKPININKKGRAAEMTREEETENDNKG